MGSRMRFFENTAYTMTAFLRLFCTAVAIPYAVTILVASYAPPSIETQLLPVLCPRPRPHELPHLAALTPRVVLGAAFVLAGAFLRLWCFHALGQQFTLQVALRSDHRLVTSGPYAYARHPSYTAAWAMLLGAYLVWSENGGYLRACGLMDTPAAWLVHSWTLAAMWTSGGLVMRIATEEEVLRRRFGAEWKAYKRRVPWRVMPYLL
ncbi:isoprenylcysteine carboxylmethyltransferase family protein [Phanerochaete sordida]|uniref:Protein-S-isoprenylcysteine O-methyltransferase n=1 Tax=Phanerochaete sordida TaxID=48140 RepID=A0A9P3GHY4_9APHY|nr:isoprenylcysteine carboxylmethyltransferase family protein [Phanerochaete sordida]